MSQPKITHYKIVTHPEHLEVVSAVKTWIDDGWQPWGGVSVAVAQTPDGYTTVKFAQALVKHGE